MHRSIRSALVVLALAWATVCQARPGPGDIPPDYLGHDRDGHDVLVSGMRGKLVIVSFWASWCGYCRKELPVLAVLQKLKGSDQLKVVGVNHDDDYDKFKDLRRRWKDLDVILTYDAANNQIAKPYQINGLPFMVMIGRDGRIAHVHTGYGEDSQDMILSEVDELLAQPAPEAAGARLTSP